MKNAFKVVAIIICGLFAFGFGMCSLLSTPIVISSITSGELKTIMLMLGLWLSGIGLTILFISFIKKLRK